MRKKKAKSWGSDVASGEEGSVRRGSPRPEWMASRRDLTRPPLQPGGLCTQAFRG